MILLRFLRYAVRTCGKATLGCSVLWYNLLSHWGSERGKGRNLCSDMKSLVSAIENYLNERDDSDVPNKHEMNQMHANDQVERGVTKQIQEESSEHNLTLMLNDESFAVFYEILIQMIITAFGIAISDNNSNSLVSLAAKAASRVTTPYKDIQGFAKVFGSLMRVVTEHTGPFTNRLFIINHNEKLPSYAKSKRLSSTKLRIMAEDEC